LQHQKNGSSFDLFWQHSDGEIGTSMGEWERKTQDFGHCDSANANCYWSYICRLNWVIHRSSPLILWSNISLYGLELDQQSFK
jgi:hypothetical protein